MGGGNALPHILSNLTSLFFSPPSKSSSCGLLHRPVHRRHGWALPVSRRAAVARRLKAPSREVWGSNSRIGLEDSPRCVLPCTCVRMLCLSSILRRRRREIYQQIRLHAENSEVPAEKAGMGFPPSLPLSFYIISGPRRVFSIMSM